MIYLSGLSTALGGTGALSVKWPNGHQSGDVAILAIETSGDGSTLSVTSGWTAVGGSPLVDVATTAGSRFYAWWKRASSSSEPAVSIADTGDHQFAKIFTFRGCTSTGTPFADSATVSQSTASTSITAPSVTATADASVIAILASHPSDTASGVFSSAVNANLTGIREAYDAGTTAGNGGGICLYTGTLSNAGASGTTVLNRSASLTGCAYVLALTPVTPSEIAATASDFPALAPASRSYSMGIFPVTIESGFGGGSIRFLHGSISSGHTLDLGYENLTATEAALIRDHYRLLDGTHQSFLLSAEAWAGHTSATDLVPTTTRWKYAGPPQETHKRGGLVNVSVSLLSVI